MDLDQKGESTRATTGEEGRSENHIGKILLQVKYRKM